MADTASASAIDAAFGGVDGLAEAFKGACAKHFGSGWGWLVKNADGTLAVTDTHDADTPLAHGQTPILTCDVWEHAYYLNYQNRRPDYIAAFFNVINWDKVADNYAEAKG